MSGPRLGSEVNNHFLVMDGAKGHLGWSEDSSEEGTFLGMFQVSATKLSGSNNDCNYFS